MSEGIPQPLSREKQEKIANANRSIKALEAQKVPKERALPAAEAINDYALAERIQKEIADINDKIAKQEKIIDDNSL